MAAAVVSVRFLESFTLGSVGCMKTLNTGDGTVEYPEEPGGLPGS